MCLGMKVMRALLGTDCSEMMRREGKNNDRIVSYLVGKNTCT
jgi:hypothetical protein